MKSYFTKAEWILWSSSIALILFAFLIFDRGNGLTLAASLIGVTSLIFNAKGNPVGQVLMILFSLFYGVISWRCSYYGEMATYLGMTAPMALFALLSWLRNPYEGNRAEVAVNQISGAEWRGMLLLSMFVTAGFYFLLEYFGTANLLPSTLSVTTSFVAVYLTFRRSPYFALAYAANDVVLIGLWMLASMEDRSCVSVVICFALFLLNDVYGFVSWRGMERRQRAAASGAEE